MNGFDLAYSVGAVLLAPLWMRKTRGGWDERVGKIQPLPAKTRKRIMVHGVSVGEQGALRTLVPMLVDGGAEVLVTVSTDTGMEQAKKLYGAMEHVHVRRYPLDFSWSVRRFLDTAAIDAAALCELEVWPNFIAQCAARKVPVVVINGRLSAKSFKGYKRLRPLLKPTFARLSLAAVQDEAYAERFRAMGVADARVTIADTMKWDTARMVQEGEVVPGAAELAAEMGIDPSRPLVVAGSTSEGEEKLLHEACPPGVQLLCAPRKPERFDQAAADLPNCVRRSGTKADRAGIGSTKQRFLLDTLGELRKAYALADVAVIGRSFALPGAQKGGSDPIEPVALGKPTLIGPSYENFTTVVETLKGAGGLDVVTAGELRVVLGGLLSDASKRAAMARRGRACIKEHQGATKRHAELLLGLL
ncbi:MAG: glycosyltransferase N-terminal domain-containing protein [Phycisphaerales bacterium]